MGKEEQWWYLSVLVPIDLSPRCRHLSPYNYWSVFMARFLVSMAQDTAKTMYRKSECLQHLTAITLPKQGPWEPSPPLFTIRKEPAEFAGRGRSTAEAVAWALDVMTDAQPVSGVQIRYDGDRLGCIIRFFPLRFHLLADVGVGGKGNG